MEEKIKEIQKAVFLDLREAERIIQKAIKKMTVIDKIIKGEYKEEKQEKQEKKEKK